MSADTETPVEKVEEPTSTPSTTTPANDEPTPSSNGEAAVEYDTKRVYIGNLPFRSTHKDLRDLFEDFHISSLNIPKSKVTHSSGRVFFKKLGYAFAEFPTEEDAKKAVESVNEKVLNDRQLNVRFARVLDRKARKEKSAAAAAAAASTAETNGNDQSSTTTTSSKEGGTSKAAPKKPAPRRRRPTGPDSTDTVFLGNLPVDTTVEELEEFFKPLSPVEVKLAIKKPRKAKRKDAVITLPGRTLGFVKLADEATQKKAIDEYNGKTFKDVELQVKVATQLVEEEAEEEGAADVSSADATDADATSEAASAPVSAEN
ncbi:hypothetical protein AWJ20_2081 [Sugiyamaella lignohabitans]|uniref:RRM domain-containing protein n=1 Tax=Sugiyamaella lignohabitans TaxID=796027 RepID=A0A167EUV0_9ASCO|nr:uncharacterized protein AWJ20_2081 [Sugiyamaella lignohabitans]ANB14488.1 hypothetical protein AWJ20_2081 [Sugiyamaella lignohabitans]